MNPLETLRGTHLRVTPLDGPADPAPLAGRLAGLDDAAMLESTASHEALGRYSLYAIEPTERLELNGRILSSRTGEVLADNDEAIWSTLQRALRPIYTGKLSAAAPPYRPGWIGYVGYEVGRRIERLPEHAPRDTALPDLRLAFYPAVLVFDGYEKTWQLLEVSAAPDKPTPQGRHLREMLDASAAVLPAEPIPRCEARPGESNFTPDAYRRAVQRAIDYIAAGDIFQVNLSQRFAMQPTPPADAIYRALRQRNPAWYAAMLRFRSNGHTCSLAGSSPELFLRVRDGQVTTRPIKGTRRRVGRGRDDYAMAEELLNSEKDHAELAMIVDLLRNDLGRICRCGSVRVAEPYRLETHPTVFHLVSTVQGQLADGVGPAGLLRATFPGGSITGAPKIRAMEIIDELEPVARGPYTGCVGWVGINGDCEWNIAIRTVVTQDETAWVQVGGGIVADSTPQGEYDETLDKARALFEAIAAAERFPQSSDCRSGHGAL